ncbi:MAG: hypothetical protein M3321_01930 [Actinomycetota bacterium]|nr:hypothetical protein [Actinomycetota bacterium]
MAETPRHAAGRSIYEVHELLGALDLGSRFRCSDYLEAFDFALDFLQEHDPEREGKVGGLEIKQVTESREETVWSYRHAEAGKAPADLVAVWGFDPGHWQGPTGLRA